MNIRTFSVLAGLSPLFCSPLATAQPADAPILREMAACRGLTPIAERVACYDRIVLPVDAAQARPVAPSATFGLPAPRPVQTAPDTIESRVDGRFDGWNPGTRIKLANGQMWEVVDSGRASYDLQAPAVRITRGLFGSYFLEISGVSATPRVRRVQ